MLFLEHMSDEVYNYHGDEGYADDSYSVEQVEIETTFYPEDPGSYYTGEEDSRYIPR